MTVALATAAFKAEMAEHIKDYLIRKGGSFVLESIGYSRIGSPYGTIRNMTIGSRPLAILSPFERHDFEMVINLFHSWACALVKPLPETVVPRDESNFDLRQQLLRPWADLH